MAMYLGLTQVSGGASAGGGGGSDGLFTGEVSSRGEAYSSFVSWDAGTWNFATIPAQSGIDVKMLNKAGETVASATTDGSGLAVLKPDESVASTHFGLPATDKQNSQNRTDDGTITSLSTPISVSFELVGKNIDSISESNLETITTSGQVPRSGRCALVLVGGGAHGGASAGGTSVGGGGRSGTINVLLDVVLDGTEMISISAPVGYNAAQGVGATTVGNYSSADGYYGTPVWATSWEGASYAMWEAAKAYGHPIIEGCTTAGGGGTGGMGFETSMKFRIGRGGQCNSNASTNASGYGAGGGGGFWNGHGGGNGTPGIVYIYWYD